MNCIVCFEKPCRCKVRNYSDQEAVKPILINKYKTLKEDLQKALKEIKTLYESTRKEAIKEYKECGGSSYYEYTSGQAHGVAESIKIIESVLERHETNN